MFKNAYIREYSDTIRRFNPKLINYEIDDILKIPEYYYFSVERNNFSLKIMALPLLRCRQRLLQNVWNKWIKSIEILDHDYTVDIIHILNHRHLTIHELRSEIEIETLARWAMRYQSNDPTNISSIFKRLTSRSLRYQLLQDIRLEIYHQGDIIIYQNESIKSSDGHITILQGQAEAFILPSLRSQELYSLQNHMKNKCFSEAKNILYNLPSIYTFVSGNGYGEYCSSYTKEWSITLAAHRECEDDVYILIISLEPFLKAIQQQRLISDISYKSNIGAHIDFLRSFGFARFISYHRLMDIATNMMDIQATKNELLYTINSPAKAIYFIANGTVICDTNPENSNSNQLFVNTSPMTCYLISHGSILGEESFIGFSRTYESTAVATSLSRLFIIDNLDIIAQVIEIIKNSRTAALTHKDKLSFSSTSRYLNEINIYASVGSLRQSISVRNTFRGVCEDIWRNDLMQTSCIKTIAKVDSEENSKDEILISEKQDEDLVLSKSALRKIEYIVASLRKTDSNQRVRLAQEALLSSEISFSCEYTRQLYSYRRLLSYNRADSTAVSSRINKGGIRTTTPAASLSRIDSHYKLVAEQRKNKSGKSVNSLNDFSQLFALDMKAFTYVPPLQLGIATPPTTIATSPSVDSRPILSRASSLSLQALVPEHKIKAVRSSHSTSRRLVSSSSKALIQHFNLNDSSINVMTNSEIAKETETESSSADVSGLLPKLNHKKVNKRQNLEVASLKDIAPTPHHGDSVTAMQTFQKVITADLQSQRSNSVIGRNTRSAHSVFRVFGSERTDSKATEDLLEWKKYCIDSALKFKLEGRLSIPILQQRKSNPSSFRWANTLHMTTAPDGSNDSSQPVSYLKTYQNRYKITHRPPLHEPKAAAVATINI